jgi:hypothetical protein
MAKKQKQMFAYGDRNENGDLQLRGYSRKWNAETLDQIHPDNPSTPAIRIPEADLINTEHGFLARDEYHETKAEWRELNA